MPQAAASSGLDGGCGRKCPIALQPHFAGMPFSSPLALAVLSFASLRIGVRVLEWFHRV